MIRALFFGAFALCLGALPGLADTLCRDDRVSLRGDWGEAHFRVEIADDEEERARGLMMREALSAGAGMLFVFEQSRPVSFWMENTLIPLDMIFVDEAGRVARVHENAVPGDRTLIPSGVPVRYVLEIGGGLARAFGIGQGTEMRHPSISQTGAVWPCSRKP